MIRSPKLPSEIAQAVTNSGLKLTINSSEQCNLRCVYCYETFALGHMKLDVAHGIVRLIEKRVADGLDWLEIEFFGGEPLGAWNRVKYVTGNVYELCQRHGIKFIGGMTTNATLLHMDRLKWLVQHGIKAFQITLDGPREIHDARRVSPQRIGSFDVIWQRLVMMHASDLADLDVTIRVHFDASSSPALAGHPSFIDTIIETLVRHDPRFKLHFHAIGNWGAGSAEGIKFFAGRQDADAALQELLARVGKAGLGPSQVPQLGDGPETGESGYAVCYAARANAFVIRANGTVSKCTVAFDDGRNIVGRLTKDGELIIDHELHIPWLRGLVSGDASALACPARGLIWPM
ncbi:MAG: radical SAM protein [Rhodomicrobium sp.]